MVIHQKVFQEKDQKISISVENIRFSGPVNVFHRRRLPEAATPVGYGALIDAYGALIDAYGLRVPVPIKLAATGERHRVTDTSAWLIMAPRHRPEATLRGHLTFALKYEGLDLAVLKRLFLTTGLEPIANWVRDEPTGSYARRI